MRTRARQGIVARATVLDEIPDVDLRRSREEELRQRLTPWAFAALGSACGESLVLGGFPAGQTGDGSGGVTPTASTTGDSGPADDSTTGGGDPNPPDVTAQLWAPFVELTVDNPSWDGNPHDIRATVTFSHEDSGAEHMTEMFYGGGEQWRFRFAGTALGSWSFVSTSDDPDLDERSGSISVEPNPDPLTVGFSTSVTSSLGTHWGRPRGNDDAVEVFVPQLVMMPPPAAYLDDPDGYRARIDAFVADGFSGIYIHTVGEAWVDADGDPNEATFDALEAILAYVHTRGATTHVWAWDGAAQVPGGVGSDEHERVLRHIAARLGPIPSWSLAYGLAGSWLTLEQIAASTETLRLHLGWPHPLGGRSPGPESGSDHAPFVPWHASLGYAGYPHIAPDYDVYVAAMTSSPDKPILSEDRFRVRDPVVAGDPEFSDIAPRMWLSTMAGGVGNIWANFLDGGSPALGSAPFPTPVRDAVATYATFWRERFAADLTRVDLSVGAVALQSEGATRAIVFALGTDAIDVDLSGLPSLRAGVAVDIRTPYAEVDVGALPVGAGTITLPYLGDWAIALGE
ncbi:MAG: DUF5060 domain-containing protein [Myxococcota bacterium]